MSTYGVEKVRDKKLTRMLGLYWGLSIHDLTPYSTQVLIPVF